MPAASSLRQGDESFGALDPQTNWVEEAVRLQVRWGTFSEPIDSLGLSPAATSFFQQLFERDPRRRLTAKRALAHPWLAAVAV